MAYRHGSISGYLENAFEKLGYTLTRAGNIPVFYTDIDIGCPGPKVLILGDLDSLMIDRDAVVMNPDGTALLQ